MVGPQPEYARRISQWLIDFAASLPAAQRGIIHELQYYHSHRFKSEDPSLPAGTEIELNAIWIIEAFRVEELKDLEFRIQQVFADHTKARWFPASRAEDIPSRFEFLHKRIVGGAWANLGYIDPNQDAANPALPLVNAIHFDLHAYFHNLAFLVIRVEPSKAFNQRFQEIIRKNYGERVVFNLLRLLGMNRHWRAIHESAHRVKAEDLAALNSELTAGTSSYFGRYFSGYFSSRAEALPSFEVYTYQEAPPPPPPTALPASGTTPSAVPRVSLPMRTFWASLGMERDRFPAYCDSTRTTFLFRVLESKAAHARKPIKILIDRTKITLEGGHSDLQSQIRYDVSEWMRGLAPLWAVQNILYSIEDRLPDFRDEIFLYAHSWKKWWPFPLTTTRLKQNTDWFTFERLRGDFRLRDVHMALSLRGIPTLTRKLAGSSHTDEFTKDLLNEIRSHIHHARKTFVMVNTAFDELLQINVIRSNFWLQVVMLILTIVTLWSAWPSKTVPHATRPELIPPHAADSQR